MLLAGDELGNTQGGNNNAYAQDNPTGWIDWAPERVARHGLVDFVKRLIAFRKAHPNVRRAHFLTGAPVGNDAPDVVWLTPQGVPKNEEDWRYPDAHVLSFLLNGVDSEPAAGAQPYLLFFLNAHYDAMSFVIPQGYAPRWEVAIDTAAADGRGLARTLAAGESCALPARTTVVLQGWPERAPPAAS